MLHASSRRQPDSLQAAGVQESYFEEYGDACRKPCLVKAVGQEEGVLNSQYCKKWQEFVLSSGKRLPVTNITAKSHSRLCCFATNRLEDQILN